MTSEVTSISSVGLRLAPGRASGPSDSRPRWALAIIAAGMPVHPRPAVCRSEAQLRITYFVLVMRRPRSPLKVQLHTRAVTLQACLQAHMLGWV